MIFHRSRRNLQLPALEAQANACGYRLRIRRDWLEDHTLVSHALEEERRQWDSVGLGFDLEEA